jgi:hypothetical protein
MTLQTDNGSEFKKEFSAFLYENNILHKKALPGRHKQNSNVESLNRQMGRLLNGYMNMMEVETGQTFTDWDTVLPAVIKKMNKYRKDRRGSLSEAKNPYVTEIGTTKLPKFQIGDLVHEKLDRPNNALGYRQNTEQFREGDYRYSTVAKRIVKVIVMNDEPYYRYMLKGLPNVSYSETEIFLSTDTKERVEVKKIIDSRTKNKKKEYLIWWKGLLKKESTWELAEALIEDGLEDIIKIYDKGN